jgi:hypothetical protein
MSPIVFFAATIRYRFVRLICIEMKRSESGANVLPQRRDLHPFSLTPSWIKEKSPHTLQYAGLAQSDAAR